MGRADYLKLGDWNAICDRCGFKYKASQLKAEWTGLRVCSQCWERRHPQDYVRGVYDKQAPPWTRPETLEETLTLELQDGSVLQLQLVGFLDLQQTRP